MHERNALRRPPLVGPRVEPLVVLVDPLWLVVDDVAFGEDEYPADDEHAAPTTVSTATSAVPSPSCVIPRRDADRQRIALLQGRHPMRRPYDDAPLSPRRVRDADAIDFE